MHDSGAGTGQGTNQRAIRVSGQAVLRAAMPIYLALLLAILTVSIVLLLVRLTHVLLLMFISVLFAAALSGPTRRMDRLRVLPAISAVLIYFVTLAAFVALGWFVVPWRTGQFASEELPSG